MQMLQAGLIPVTSITSEKLQAFVATLNEVAVPKYFSEIELDDTNLSTSNYAFVNFYIDDTLVMQFKVYKSSVYSTIRIILPDREFSMSANAYAPGERLLVTDNAIIFFPSTSYSDASDSYVAWGTLIIICKSTDDKTMCIYHANEDGTSLLGRSSEGASLGFIYQHTFGEQSVADNKFRWFVAVSPNTASVETAVTIPANSGNVPNEVYHAITRSIYQTPAPFLFTNGGESYCGIAYNNYIIKTT